MCPLQAYCAPAKLPHPSQDQPDQAGGPKRLSGRRSSGPRTRHRGQRHISALSTAVSPPVGVPSGPSWRLPHDPRHRLRGPRHGPSIRGSRRHLLRPPRRRTSPTAAHPTARGFGLRRHRGPQRRVKGGFSRQGLTCVPQWQSTLHRYRPPRETSCQRRPKHDRVEQQDVLGVGRDLR